MLLIKEDVSKQCPFLPYGESSSASHINYIFNLSSIIDDLNRERARLKHLLLTGSLINPYYYLLSRIYSDGFLLNERILPPLSIVQPYHSEHIKTQKGVFSVFPFYKEQPEDRKLRAFGFIPEGMENNLLAQDCLYQIIIQNPQETALQMMKNGMIKSWLYPESPIVSSEIENHEIF